ncbi:MAG: response regulator [Bacteroidota bacterium]
MVKEQVEKRPIILLVDDNPVDLELNAIALRRTRIPMDILEFPNGEEVLMYLRELRPDDPIPELMFLDLKMPIMDGFEVLAMMQQENLTHFPVVVLSSSSLPEDMMRAQQLGAMDCYEKPLSLTENLTLFKRVVNQYVDVHAMT